MGYQAGAEQQGGQGTVVVSGGGQFHRGGGKVGDVAGQAGVGEGVAALVVALPGVQAGQDGDDVAGQGDGQQACGGDAGGIAAPPAVQALEEMAGTEVGA